MRRSTEPRRRWVSVVAIALLASSWLGCETPQARIKRDRPLYESFSPEAQRKIAAGQVDVGFSPEMVLMALGRPTLKYERESQGTRQEVWVYRERGGNPGVGLSIGGAIGSSVGVGGGVGVDGSAAERRDRARVVLEKGRVVEAELAP